MKAPTNQMLAAFGITTILATTLLVLCLTAPALALGPSVGTQVPNSALPMGSTIGAPEFYNGQVIEVKIPPNSHFKPGLLVNILECADPGGSSAHLPINANTCDGNTIQGPTVLIQKDGSVDYKGYTIYSLPNFEALGEPKDNQPICNTTHECVLYIGQNQEDFKEPHYWSQPFFVAATKSAVSLSPTGAGGISALLIIVVVVVVLGVIGITVWLVRRWSGRSGSRHGRRPSFLGR
jgi:hypothetical protein